MLDSLLSSFYVSMVSLRRHLPSKYFISTVIFTVALLAFTLYVVQFQQARSPLASLLSANAGIFHVLLFCLLLMSFSLLWSFLSCDMTTNQYSTKKKKDRNQIYTFSISFRNITETKTDKIVFLFFSWEHDIGQQYYIYWYIILSYVVLGCF